ncbi:hypothetical protein NMG60_11014092 [Bertholletia excelsa]
MRTLNFVLAALVVLVFLLSIKTNQGCRLLDGEREEWAKKEGLLLQSLPRGPVTRPSPNPGTYIPSSRRTTAKTIGQRGFVGHAMPPPPPPPPPVPFPEVIVPFGVAKKQS